MHNISKIVLSNTEMNLLEKGLNFCPPRKDVNKEEISDDVCNDCCNIRLKDHFSRMNGHVSHVLPNEQTGLNTFSTADNLERCEMKSKHKNPFYYPPTNSTPSNLEKYLASTKADIMKLVEKPTKSSSNLSLTERETLKSLQKRSDIIIHSADKGEKIVVMDKDVYINNCKYQLDTEEFYTKIDHDPTANICENIESEISKMVEKKFIDKKESQLPKEN